MPIRISSIHEVIPSLLRRARAWKKRLPPDAAAVSIVLSLSQCRDKRFAGIKQRNVRRMMNSTRVSAAKHDPVFCPQDQSADHHQKRALAEFFTQMKIPTKSSLGDISDRGTVFIILIFF